MASEPGLVSPNLTLHSICIQSSTQLPCAQDSSPCSSTSCPVMLCTITQWVLLPGASYVGSYTFWSGPNKSPRVKRGGGGDMGGMRLCFGGQGLTRNPNTGLPPGSLHMAGTATTLVISSQMVSMRPSVPWGISGSGSLLIRLLSSTGTCMQTMHHHLILFRSHMQIYSHKFLLKRTVALAPACRPCIITWFWSDHTYRCKITYS